MSICNVKENFKEFESKYKKILLSAKKTDGSTLNDAEKDKYILQEWKKVSSKYMSNEEINMMNYLKEVNPDGLLISYNNSNKQDEITIVGVKADSGIVTVYGKDKEYTFKTGSKKSNTTKSGNYVIAEAMDNINRQILGSQETEMNTKQLEDFYYDKDATLSNTENIIKVLNEIDSKDPEYDKDWTENLNRIINKTINIAKFIKDSNIKLKAQSILKAVNGTYNETTGEIIINVEQEGTTGSELRNELSMSHTEVYGHELVHAALDGIFNSNISEFHQYKNRLRKMYEKARKATEGSKGDIFLDKNTIYTDLAKKEADKRWNYIFGKDQDINTGIKEFTAHIMTNKEFATAMEEIVSRTKIKKEKDETILNTINRIFYNFLDNIAGLVKREKNDESIRVTSTKIIWNMMKANQKQVDKHIGNQKRTISEKSIQSFDKGMNKLDETLREPVEKILTTVIGDARNNKGVSVKGLEVFNDIIKKEDLQNKNDKRITKWYKLLKISKKLRQAGLESEEVSKLYGSLLREMNYFEDGLIRDFLQDFATKDSLGNDISDSILKLTHEVDGLREKTYEQVKEDIYSWFKNINIKDKNNKAMDEALDDVILRNDIQALDINADELEELLNGNKLKEEINKSISDIKKDLNKKTGNRGPTIKSIVIDSQLLSNYMTRGTGQITNPGNIARGFGLDTSVGYDEKVEYYNKLALKIDRLVSLYNLQETSSESKAKIEELIELDKDGVNSFIKYSKGKAQQSKKEMELEPWNEIKGYVNETFDRDIEIKIEPMINRKELEEKGYKFKEFTQKSIGDIDSTPYGIFISEYGVIEKRVNGAIGIQDTKNRGITLRDKVGIKYENSSAHIKVKEFKKAMANANKVYNGLGKKDMIMYPIYDKHGTIINYRYTMSREKKIEYLKMKTRGSENIAKTFGIMSLAKKTEEHNFNMIDRIFEDYDKNYLKDPKAYQNIKGDVAEKESWLPNKKRSVIEKIRHEKDIEYEELWAVLPKSTRRYAEYKFGRNEIIVRRDMIKSLFGYRTFSLADAKIAKGLSIKQRTQIRKYERYWQDAMQIAKSNIVIKTFDVFLGNIWSNTKILMYLGMNPYRAVGYLSRAREDLKIYERDLKEKNQLQRLKASGENGLDRRINDLDKLLKENPMHVLIDAGLYQSIVEDVNTTDESNRIVRILNQQTDKLPVGINEILQHIFITEKTKPYQAMLKATQVSDLWFRYAQYYDSVENKGHSSKQALRDVTDNYINYEDPLNMMVNYGDKMGPFMFVTYFTRIQRVVKKIAKSNPGRLGTDILLQALVTGDNDDINDQFILDKGLSTYDPMKVFSALREIISPSGLEWIGVAR